jgi:dTDP-4-amino-4,6-dideoxygalactose transaminase
MNMSTVAAQIPFVDLKAQYQSIKPEIDAAIAAVISETAFVGGPHVKSFEEAFAVYCGVGHCVGVANGTDALFVALRTLGIGAGDEVITVANSFVATSEAIRMAGAQVVFVDSDSLTMNIDVNRIEEKITARTKAIIPVHLYGQPADMAPIRALADRHGLRIVGDAAQAHGALYRGHPIAQLADITCFSFYPGKNHGRSKKYDHDFEGVNSRLDGLQAAILGVKLRHLDAWSEGRRRNARLYNEALGGTGLVTPSEIDDCRAVYHLYVVRVPGGRRDSLQQHLAECGVNTGIHYPIALPYLNAYRYLGHTAADFPEALRASGEILSLPMFPELTSNQIRCVADAVASAAI